LTMLYRSTDRRSRRRAPMQNLAHSASFESLDKDAPSKAGTKQLASALNGNAALPAPAELIDMNQQVGGVLVDAEGCGLLQFARAITAA